MAAGDGEALMIRSRLSEERPKAFLGLLDPWIVPTRRKPHALEMPILPQDFSARRHREPVVTLDQLLNGDDEARRLLRHR